MSLTKTRYVYRPFDYQQAFDFFQTQTQSFWIPSEVSMESDIHDWKNNLSEAEKDVIINTLRLFTQAEIAVQDNFWNVIPKKFKKPEIAQMSASFANMEAIHQWGYAYLNDSLGLPEEEFSKFVQEPTMKAKIDYFCKKHSNLPLFLATLIFIEGVSLFSSFAILINFSRFGKLKGIKQIIEFSARDESLHSLASTWLFNQYVAENDGILTKELVKEINDMVATVVSLEDDYIDRVFALCPNGIQGLTKEELKKFVRHRANSKLMDIKFGKKYKTIKDEDNLEWFNVMIGGESHSDFFSTRVTHYTQGKINFGKVKF